MTAKPHTIDDYISTFPEDIQKLLQAVRRTIHETAPELTESISYGIPTFNQDGHYVVYFAGWKHHISVYPVPAGDESFQKDLAQYDQSGRGTVQFPLDQPVPHELIARLVKFRLQEAHN